MVSVFLRLLWPDIYIMLGAHCCIRKLFVRGAKVIMVSVTIVTGCLVFSIQKLFSSLFFCTRTAVSYLWCYLFSLVLDRSNCKIGKFCQTLEMWFGVRFLFGCMLLLPVFVVFKRLFLSKWCTALLICSPCIGLCSVLYLYCLVSFSACC